MSLLSKAFKQGRKNIHKASQGATRIAQDVKKHTNLANTAKYVGAASVAALGGYGLYAAGAALEAGTSASILGTGAGIYQNNQLSNRANAEAEELNNASIASQREATAANNMSILNQGTGASGMGGVERGQPTQIGGGEAQAYGSSMGGASGWNEGLVNNPYQKKNKIFLDTINQFTDSLR